MRSTREGPRFGAGRELARGKVFPSWEVVVGRREREVGIDM